MQLLKCRLYKIGINNNYPFYYTSWSATVDNRRVAYSNVGSAPNAMSFSVLPGDFTVVSTGINDIDYTYSGNFQSCLGRWGYSEVVGNTKTVVFWNVERPVDSRHPIIMKFPDEVVNDLPFLNGIQDKLHYGESSFTINLNGAANQYARFESDVFHPYYEREVFSVLK